MLSYKIDDQSYSLSETENNFLFFSESIEVCFNKDDFSLTDITLKDKNEQTIHLQKAAEMRFILEGAKALAHL